MSGKLLGLLLDFDGTIAETERFGQRVAYNHAFAELGLDWHWDETLYGELLAVAGGKERLRYYLERCRPELLNDAIASGLIIEVHHAKIRHFAKIAPTIPLRPGLLRLVREASAAGVLIAIAMTASRPGVEALLSQDQTLSAMVNLERFPVSWNNPNIPSFRRKPESSFKLDPGLRRGDGLWDRRFKLTGNRSNRRQRSGGAQETRARRLFVGSRALRARGRGLRGHRGFERWPARSAGFPLADDRHIERLHGKG